MAVPSRPFLWHGTCAVVSTRSFFAPEDVTLIRTIEGVALAWGAALASLLCALTPVASSAATRQPAPDATIQELMTTRIDPAADALWASVSTVITAAGTQEKQPRTEAEWQTVRRYAVTLIEGANLLAVPTRRVTVPGGATEDSAIPGIERPESIQKAVDIDRASFVRAALQLRDAGIAALRAIDQRNPQRLIDAGGDLDAACEACHLKYWYPHSPRPK
jgi:hypothetical protein